MAVRRLYRYTHNALRSTVDCLRPEPVRPVRFAGRLGPALGQQIVAKLVRGLALLSRLVQDAVELRAPIALAVVADGT
jgi:hypothetical protein